MTRHLISEQIASLRQRILDLNQRLDKPGRTDKAALKEALGALVEELAELGAAGGQVQGEGIPVPLSEGPKDEFLSTLGHEFRNSLAPILNSIHVLQLRGTADEGQRRFLDVIDRQTRHMAHLVDNLLDVSRITRGKIELHKGMVGLASLVNAAVENCRPLIDSRSQKLTVNLPPRPVMIEGDAPRLEQVLENLLSNAAKYTDIGGHIWLTGDFQNGQLTLRLRDSGVGLSAELLEHIFDPFGPVEDSLGHTRGGLGLGLTLAQGLVRMHGGTIEAASEGVGKGSEFTIRLPAIEETTPQAPAIPTEAAAGENHPLRVLVIEDNKDTASTLGVILKLWGHEIEIAYNGHAGLNVAHQFHPDVVLLDIELPGLDGYEVARAMRHLPELERTTIIAISGYGQPEDQERSRAAGINFHYTKPIDLPLLRKQLAASEKKAAV